MSASKCASKQGKQPVRLRILPNSAQYWLTTPLTMEPPPQSLRGRPLNLPPTPPSISTPYQPWPPLSLSLSLSLACSLSPCSCCTPTTHSLPVSSKQEDYSLPSSLPSLIPTCLASNH
ncbi:hypothetical protein ABZP36_015771 [Zizania latifolia]